jgi:hypothetical protein
MHECRQCGGEVGRTHRFCPWCAAPQRVKLVEFFPAHPEVVSDEGKALRVTRYVGAEPGVRHVRFSVWDETGTAEAAVSLEEVEAARLAEFLRPATPGRRSLLEQLKLQRHA